MRADGLPPDSWAGNGVFLATERLQGMNEDTHTTTTSALVSSILTDCFAPATPHSIDRYTDSPRVRGIYAAVIESFPDASFTPLWSVADDRRVAIGGLTRATHLGTWRDVPATGRAIEVLTTMMLELSGGGIVDLMVVTDSLAIAEQIGAVDPLGPKSCAHLPAYGADASSGRFSCGDGIFSRSGR